MNNSDTIQKIVFVVVAILVPLLVAGLLFMPKETLSDEGSWVYSLPFFNAIINSFTALLLIAGFIFVKSGKVTLHKASMAGAFVLGIVFLVFYIIYHSSVASTPFGGEGWVKFVYFFFLISHILLSMGVVPLVLSSIFFAVFGRLDSHRRVAKYTFPVWLYVSVSGVIVYLMISQYYINR